ncbi:hypothetical protein EX30DRAFT_248681 [Ascodesmis nigricans]|uniref:Uncharacterized protein n=1 Tax=Ascodesmis nigricans TaxID=341454 RepID=A0A4S2MY10_9PEZI|nr:hypothetical protein EX30DRAFT_248681 [Ascodesmis nigricans]
MCFGRRPPPSTTAGASTDSPGVRIVKPKPAKKKQRRGDYTGGGGGGDYGGEDERWIDGGDGSGDGLDVEFGDRGCSALHGLRISEMAEGMVFHLDGR